MELFIVSLLLFATMYYFYHIYRSKSSTEYGNNNTPLPPGTKGWPVVGETLHYVWGSKKGNPEKFIAERTSRYSSNIFRTSLLNENMVFFCTAEGNKFLYSNENKLGRAWWPKTFEKIFSNSEKTNHIEETMRLRKVLSPFLKPQSLQKYIGIMDLETKKRFNTQWDGRDQVTVYPLAKKYPFTLGCRLLLNIEEKEMLDKFEMPIRQISAGFVSSFPVDIPGTKYRRAIEASKKLRRDMEEVVAQRRRDVMENRAPTTPDILSHLLVETYRNGETVNDSDIANKLYGLLHGAYDNISALLTSIVSFLADLPHVYDRVREEQMRIASSKEPGDLLNWMDLQKMKYSWNVACEVMRLVPPIQGSFREVITDFVYEGFLIPKGLLK